MPLLHIRKQIDYKSTEKRGKWSLNRNNRKNEKIKKKQLTRRMKGAIIAKSLVRQSISTKKTKKSLKKVVKKFGGKGEMILSLHPLSPRKWGG